MSEGNLDKLLAVTEAHYMREFSKVRDLLASESRVRSALARLDAQKAQARADLSEEHAMRTMGGDVLWQAWAAQTRTILNTELAQILARKETVMDQVRSAFGRREAVRSMLKAEHRQAARKTAKRLQERLAGLGS